MVLVCHLAVAWNLQLWRLCSHSFFWIFFIPVFKTINSLWNTHTHTHAHIFSPSCLMLSNFFLDIISICFFFCWHKLLEFEALGFCIYLWMMHTKKQNNNNRINTLIKQQHTHHTEKCQKNPNNVVKKNENI